MKIRNLLSFCILFVLIPASGLFALGQAASMGNLQTVVPSGPFDASRNPALLAAQTANNATGLFYSYNMHFSNEESASAHRYDGTTSTDYNIDLTLKEPKIRGMNMTVANSTKLNTSTIGFSFTNNGDDQYSIEEREILSLVSGGTITQNSDEKTKKTTVNPALITSIGVNISNTSSIGFQILAKYSGSSEKKEYYEYYYESSAPETYEKKEKKIKKTNKFAGELGFGYFFRGNNSEIGLQLKTGELSWIKKSISVDTNRISLGTSSSADESISLNGKYTSGPSITAGGFKRVNSFFAFGLESKCTFENSFTNKELDVTDDHSSPIGVSINNNTVTTEHSYLLNGGIEFDFTKNFSFNTGIGYSKVNSVGSSGGSDFKNRQENEIRFSLLTAGIDYLISPNLRIGLIGLLISYEINSFQYNETDTTPETSNSYTIIKSKGYYVHTGLGVTMSF